MSKPTPSFARLPYVEKGQCIGLLGGSFNPAHEGHRQLSLLALKRLKLDAVWWLVTPQNPLKTSVYPLSPRLETARLVSAHPRIKVCAPEWGRKSRYTVDTLAFLQSKNPRVRFIWLMGADNLNQFHQWKSWKKIAALMPFAVIDRPQSSLKSLSSRTALSLDKARISEQAASRLKTHKSPAWVFLHGLKNAQSSTALRKNDKTKT